MDKSETALYVFRKMVYLLYLEIGALQYRIHPEIASKANLNTAYFEREKERQAAALYLETETETDPEKVLAPYVERTGLTLEEVYRAFNEGDWHNKHGAFNFGGPRWARIAELALELRKNIESGDEEAIDETIHAIKGAKTNQGFLIHQFERTERRR